MLKCSVVRVRETIGFGPNPDDELTARQPEGVGPASSNRNFAWLAVQFFCRRLDWGAGTVRSRDGLPTICWGLSRILRIHPFSTFSAGVKIKEKTCFELSYSTSFPVIASLLIVITCYFLEFHIPFFSLLLVSFHPFSFALVLVNSNSLITTNL